MQSLRSHSVAYVWTHPDLSPSAEIAMTYNNELFNVKGDSGNVLFRKEGNKGIVEGIFLGQNNARNLAIIISRLDVIPDIRKYTLL